MYDKKGAMPKKTADTKKKSAPKKPQSAKQKAFLEKFKKKK